MKKKNSLYKESNNFAIVAMVIAFFARDALYLYHFVLLVYLLEFKRQ